MDMDIKVIEQLVEQALKEIKAEQPLKFTAPKLERYGVFKTMDEAIAASEEAQKKLLFSKISDRQKYVDVIRSTIIKRENLELISRLSVEETEIGDYEHKLIKNRLAAEKTPGTEDLLTEAITGDNGLTLVEYCPFGVIGAITPTTNPTETIINNSISMIAGGNTVVFSPHPRAKKVSQMTVKMLNKALIDNGAPPNLITMVEEPSIENTNKMIDNPGVRLLVATGGPSIVKKVLSSGKKAIGAGAGNPPVVVDETADIAKAAKDIVDGCSFDNNVPCIAEKEVFAVDSICDYLIHNMKENGAYQITDPMLLEQLVALVTTEKGGPKTSFVGKSARYILDKLGIDYEMTIISAHREPDIFFQWAKGAEEKGFKVIIAGAGKAAHLPGMCAAIFPLPVIGIPMKTSDLGGVDSLYSIVQMPSGIPVATVAINGGANAGILAAKILAASDQKLLERLKAYSESLKEDVVKKAEKLDSLGYKEYLAQM